MGSEEIPYTRFFIPRDQHNQSTNMLIISSINRPTNTSDITQSKSLQIIIFPRLWEFAYLLYDWIS